MEDLSLAAASEVDCGAAVCESVACPHVPDSPAAAAAAAAAPGVACPRYSSDSVASSGARSPAAMPLLLEETLKELEFPLVEDADGEAYGEGTWSNAVAMVKALAGDGFTLVRRNKNRLLRTKKEAAASLKQDRWSIVEIVCEQGGKPEKRRCAPTHRASRRTASKKVGCTFKVVMNWPFKSAVPRVSENSMCLKHHVGSSNDSGIEHERPRVYENELSVEEIAGQVDFISRLHFSGVSTQEIHKSLEAPGKRLGERGKMKVRNMRVKLEKERSDERGAFNDAQMFAKRLQEENCWMRFETDEDGRMMCIAWAHEAQQLNALRYHSVIIQDNTFNTNLYKFHLALIVVVDKENHTQLAMQALILREQTECFVFLFEAFKELCSGAHPQVIFTDADQAAMSAIEQVYPSSLSKLCLYHISQNIRNRGGGLGEGVLAAVVGEFHAAAHAQTEEFFLEHKVDLLRLLPRESHMYEYMDKYVFAPGRVQKWASHVHPGLHTVSIASTQRVESSNSALKLVMTRAGTMVDVDRAIVGKVQDDASTILRVNSGWRVDRVCVKSVSPAESLKADLLERFHFVKEAMLYERCSGYAMEDMAAQISASRDYNAQTVAGGNDEVQRLLAELVADPKKAKLQYDTNSGEFMDPSRMSTSSAGVAVATRTSMPHFAELLEDQTVNELVRVTPLMAHAEYGHLVALGPDGFSLCTCLRQLVDRLGCPHGLKTIQNKGASFNGACIAPWWRDSDKPWTMAALSAKSARLATAGEGVGGRLTPVAANPDVLSHSQTNVRGAVYANFLSLGKELAGLSTDVNSIAGCQRVLENIKTYAKQVIADEVRSQQNASTSRVFEGAVSRPGPPDGGARGHGAGRGGMAGLKRKRRGERPRLEERRGESGR